MKCVECAFDYPDNCCVPLFINGEYLSCVCGICALQVTNSIHGTNQTEFGGEQAENLRQNALKARNKNDPNSR